MFCQIMVACFRTTFRDFRVFRGLLLSFRMDPRLREDDGMVPSIRFSPALNFA